MNKLNYALTMLTAAGGAVALSPAAHAVTLYGSFTNIRNGYAETFQLQSDGGVADAQPDYTDFTLTNDSLGNTLAIVGDNTTGIKGSRDPEGFGDSYFGTGAADSSVFGGQASYDSFKRISITHLKAPASSNREPIIPISLLVWTSTAVSWCCRQARSPNPKLGLF